MSLNLPKITRKTDVAKKSGIISPKDEITSWNTVNFGNKWNFNVSDKKKFQAAGLSAQDVLTITSYIKQPPPRFNLASYIHAARFAGIKATDFIEIAESGVLESPPDLTRLRLYLVSVGNNPMLAMLALRANLSLQETYELAETGELTVNNLRAMIDLSK